MKRLSEALAAAVLLSSLFAPGIVAAKPIAFAHGTTVMGEYGAGTVLVRWRWEGSINGSGRSL